MAELTERTKGSRGTTSGDEAPDVFFSYSRRDQAVVLGLADALEDAGWRVWVDTEDIPPSAEWSDELVAGIRAAHTFVFLISPDSIRSPYCLQELEQAVELGKKLVPVLLRPTDGVPDELARRQYIFLHEDDLGEAAAELSAALATDVEWVHGHRQWLNSALRWQESGRDRSLLLRGGELKAAEAWLARQAERTEPRPTRVQTELLLASRSWETRRLQVIVAAVAVALAVALLLGVLALLQRNSARRAAAIARSRELAIASSSQLSLDPERSLLLAIEAVRSRPTAEASSALRRAVAADRLRVEVPLPGQTVSSLVTDVAFDASGKLVAGATANGTVALARIGSTRRATAISLVKPAVSPADPCTSFTGAQGQTRLSFSPDGHVLASAGDRGWIMLWRLPRPRTPLTSPFCLGPSVPSATALVDAALGSVSPGGSVAAIAAANRSVSVVERDGRRLTWRWPQAARPDVARAADGPVLAGAFFGNRRSVVVTDGTRVVRSIAGGSSATVGLLPGASAVAVAADGRRVAAAAGRTVAVWASHPDKALRLNTPHAIRSLAITRDGRDVAAGDIDGEVRVWDTVAGGAPQVLRAAGQPVTAVAFSTDGNRLLTGGDDGVLRVWDWNAAQTLAAGPHGAPGLVAGGRLVEFDARPGRVWLPTGAAHALDGVADPAKLSISADGRHAASPARGIGIRVWDVGRGTGTRTIRVRGRVDAVAVSPDGRWIASGESQRLRLLRWPGRGGVVLAAAPLTGKNTFDAFAVAFSPDGRRIAGALYNGKRTTIEAWNVPARGSKPTGAVFRATIPGGAGGLAFDRDGGRIVAGMSDGTLRVFDIDGKSSIVLRGHHGFVSDAASSPTGDEVVSAGEAEGTVRVWELGDAGHPWRSRPGWASSRPLRSARTENRSSPQGRPAPAGGAATSAARSHRCSRTRGRSRHGR